MLTIFFSKITYFVSFLDNLEQKIMHRLASYDISKPTEVILSFDESDGEQSPNTDFDENTTNNHLSKDIKRSKAVSNRDSETLINELKSNIQELNDMDPNTKFKEEYLKDKNLSNESEKYNDHPPTKFRKLLVGTETAEEKEVNNLDKNHFLESEKMGYCEPNAKLPEKVIKIDTQKVRELCNAEPLRKTTTQKSPLSTNGTQEFVYINKLLHRVSESLLFIIKAFSLHMLVQNRSEEQNQIDKSMTSFLRLKYQLFKLCFVTVKNIMVPNAGNEGFIRQFIVDTIKLSSEKNIVCTQHQIEVILTELLAWTAEKKNALNNTNLTMEQVLENHKIESIKLTCNNNILQKTNIEKPSKLPNMNSYPEISAVLDDTTKNTINTISKWRVNSNMPPPYTTFISAPSTNSMPSVDTNSDSLIQTNYCVKRNNIPTYPANSGPVTALNNISAISASHGPLIPPNHGHVELEINTNLARGNNSLATSSNSSTKKPANDYAACKVIVNNDLAKTNSDMALKNLDVNLISLPKKPMSDVIFSSGPPGQQVSITIDHSVLRQQLQQTNGNFTPYHTAKSTIIQKPSNFLQQLETYTQSALQNWHQVQLPKQQLSQQQLPQQKLPQHQLPQQQSPRQKLPQQQSPQQQLPQQQLAQQQFLQRQLPQQQFIQQQVPPQHLPLQPMAQQHLLCNHTTNQGNQVPHSNDPKTVFFTQLQQARSYYPQNALLQNKRPPPPYRQHQSHMVPTSTHQHPNTFPHPLHPYRTLEQNEPRVQPEIIRSSSNDSGFTSPLNFNSPAPTSVQVILF